LKTKKTALLTIVVTVTTLTVLGLIAGFFSIRGGMDTLIVNDMKMIARIASKLASDRLALIKSENRNLAEHLRATSAQTFEPEKTALFMEEAAKRHQYLSMVLFDPQHKIVASYGDVIPDDSYTENPFATRARSGETVVSTTESIQEGGLVIRVYTPVGKHILISTLPGLIMNDLMSGFRIFWQGNIFIIDQTGVTVANTSPESVLKRYNLVEMSKKEQHRKNQDDIFAHMTEGESGVGQYQFDGKEHICAFNAIPGSDGWSVGITAPKAATASSMTGGILLVSGIIVLTVGGIVAFFAKNITAHPFKSISELEQFAENASAAKNSLLANTSHEMYTPLNAVIGLSELTLNDKRLSPEATDNLEKIHASGMTLLSIVNDLLDIAKIESGKFGLNPSEYDVPSLINDTRSLNVLRVADKPIEFQIRIDETIPSRLFGDELRIKQIFNNLLNNACKYTTQGSILWSIGWERAEDNDIWLISSIKDTGCGIHEEDTKKLFSDHDQTHTWNKPKTKSGGFGLGLGLGIARHIVQAMDGTISVSSVYGKGSTFTIRIRQKDIGAQPIGATVVQSLCNAGNNSVYTGIKRERNMKFTRIPMPYARILVVDDVQTNLDVAKGIMKPYGMQIDCVTSGAEAVRLVRAAQPKYDAIFMDHMMPDMDGMEAAHIIRTEIDSDYARSVPIIALTANAIASNEAIFLKNGFQAFLSKPIDIIKLDATLRQWVRNKTLEQTLEVPQSTAFSTEPEHADSASPVTGIDWQGGLRRFSGDQEVYHSILRSYTEHTAQLIDRIRNVSAETLADYAILVHGIKGSSYGIEAREAGRQAEELELAAKTGNLQFVRQYTPLFIESLERLLTDIRQYNQSTTAETEEKPGRFAPDETLLQQMKEAAENFKIDTMEEIIDSLERFNYETQAELVIWLREKVNQMEFAAIHERLAQQK
jgi:signal transduction histidine kinase/CheY-like chemotaxis protein/HPt (histidine-containing phosphotransfer) domain-containing protein